MSEQDKGDQGRAEAQCSRCILIRVFLMAVVGIALIYMLKPDTFGLIEGFSAPSIALFFVGGLGLMAAGKTALGLLKADRRNE